MNKKSLITILLTVLMSMPMFAYDFTYGNINYNIVDNNSVEVTWGNYSGDIYIYGSVYYNGKSYSVTGIGYEAFCEETKVVYVSLPSTVTYISNSAFENTRITNMTIPNSVKSIGRSAFSYCSKLTTVTIPNSVTSIGENVFYNCSNLTTIISENTNPFDIKDNVFPDLIYSTATLVVPSGTRSAYQSKAGWKKFKNIVEFGEKRTIHVATAGTLSNYISTDEKYEIEDLTLTGYLNGSDIRLIRAMAGTTSHGRTHRDPYVDYSSTNGKLKHLNLLNANIVKGGDGYITIPEWEDPEYTFHGTCTEDCYSYLYTVNNSISYKMFYLTKLESLILPNSVTSIDKSAFYSCSNLTSIIVGSGNTRYDSRDNCNAIIEKSSNTLIAGCKNSTIPNSVTRIGDGAFYECSGLTSITIPNSVTSIGENVFYNCSSLTTIVSERTNPFDINERVFLDLTYTTAKLVVPPGTKSVYQSKSGWKKFTNIVEYKKKRSIHVETAGTLPNLIEDYEKYLIEELTLTGELNGKDIRFIRNMSGIDWYLDCPTCTLSEAYDIFTAGKLKVLDISNAKIVSGGGSFYESGGSDSRPTDSYFTKDNAISDYMFCRCNLTSIKLPNSVTYIGRAFSGCSGLTSVTIGNSVTSIGGYAFYGCSGLTSITIPSSVTSIGSNAFSGCSSLNAVRISDLAAWCNIDFLCDEGKYDYLSNPLVYANHLYLNDSKVEELVIPDGVTEIKSGAFSMGKDITSLKIPNSVTSIGDNCFQYCNLSSLEIPNSVTYVGWGSFKVNQNMKSVVIPNSVTFIGGWAFCSCNALTSVTIPNSVTEIFEYTFEGCTGLNSAIIPSTVTSIGDNAFQNCNSLKYICLSSENYPSTQSLGTTSCQYIMPQTAFDGGIPQDITNYATYSVAPKYIKVKSTTATTATLELTPIDISGGNSESTTSYEVTMCDLKPGSSVVGSWKWEGKDCGIVSIPTAKTKDIVMNVQPALTMSTTKTRLLATVNEADDGKHYGFEWLRNDAPDNMTPKKVLAPLDNGKIVGTLSGLNPDIYYKYRPFYKADDGTVFVGEWEAFLTGDANVTFDPEVHTKEPVAISNDKMILLLFCAEGTEEILEKGFELIKKAIASLGTRADGGDITKVIVSGNEMSATVEGLEPGTEYICRSYVKTASGTTYGEDKTFKTPLPGDANNDGAVNVVDIVEITNARAGNPSASFNLTNADMDGNGKLTDADIDAIVNSIMQK